jgi:hypothetical protein
VTPTLECGPFAKPNSPLFCHEHGQPIDISAQIKRRRTVQGLISEYRRAA